MIIFLGNNNQHIYADLIFKYRYARDIVVSCQYPHKIPPSLIKNYPCVNIHYGILPYYRGMNPVYWQVRNGDTAGTTLHFMDENFDTGDIIAIHKFPIGNMVADEVFDACERAGVDLLTRYIEMILADNAPRRKQGDGMYYKKEDVDWDRDIKVNIHDIFLDDRKLRAACFKGKQYPKIDINGRDYELRPV